MNCLHCEILIQGALDGRLSPRQRQTLDAHAAHCSRCHGALDDYRRLAQAAESWARHSLADAEPGDAFTARLLAHLAGRPEAPPRRLPWRGWGTALLALLLLAIISLCSPVTVGLTGPTTSLLPPPKLALGAPDWLWENLRALPVDAVRLTGSLAGASWSVPPWLLEALLAALLVNGALVRRALHATGRRLTR